MANDSIDKLREDFEIYKTQVLICGVCGLVITLILICALIYAYFSIRKVKKELEARVRNLEATRRFTISRPKVYSSSDPTSKLQGEIGKAASVDSRDSRDPRPQPTRSLSPDGVSNRGSTGAYLNHGYVNFGSPPIAAQYPNVNSPNSAPNINLRSPSTNSNKSVNRVESFLNKTRQLYSSSNTTPSPRMARTPTTGTGNKDNNVFKFP